MPCSIRIKIKNMPPRARALRKPAVFASEKTRILKRLSRNIGSSTRLSMTGNMASRMRPVAIAAMTHGFPQPIGSFP